MTTRCEGYRRLRSVQIVGFIGWVWSSCASPGHIPFPVSIGAEHSDNVGTYPTAPAMNDTRPARTANPRACLQCQKRKTKCIQDPRSASCTYCTRARKECTFEEAPSRTPLTRKNLDALEQRCKRLENLVRSLSQGVNVEAQMGQAGEEQDASRLRNESNDAGDAASEEYEWHESPASTGPKTPHLAGNDGMASMAVESSGYLGTDSG